jgi:hypothetical protein
MLSHALYTVFAMRGVCVCAHDVDDVRVDSFNSAFVPHNTSNNAGTPEIDPFLNSYTYPVHTPYIPRTYPKHTPNIPRTRFPIKVYIFMICEWPVGVI